MITLILVVALASGVAGVGSASAQISALIERATRTYDLEAARSALEQVRAWPREMQSRSASSLHVRAALLVAELERLAFERLPEERRAERREIGDRIDAAAAEGLAILEGIPRASEHLRWRADLLGTMIRSDYRATRHLDAMKEATARALEMDPENARAWVTRAKPLVFADPEHGRDLDEAVRLLTRALELEHGLESALLLRAMAHDLAGRKQQAVDDLSTVLERNPECTPARQRLKELDGE